MAECHHDHSAIAGGDGGRFESWAISMVDPASSALLRLRRHLTGLTSAECGLGVWHIIDFFDDGNWPYVLKPPHPLRWRMRVHRLRQLRIRRFSGAEIEHRAARSTIAGARLAPLNASTAAVESASASAFAAISC